MDDHIKIFLSLQLILFGGCILIHSIQSQGNFFYIYISKYIINIDLTKVCQYRLKKLGQRSAQLSKLCFFFLASWYASLNLQCKENWLDIQNSSENKAKLIDFIPPEYGSCQETKFEKPIEDTQYEKFFEINLQLLDHSIYSLNLLLTNIICQGPQNVDFPL